MKKKVNSLLVTAFLISIAMSACCYLMWNGVIPIGSFSDTAQLCAFSMPAVSFTLLQMLLCRLSQRKWVRWIPLALIAIVAVVSAIGWSMSIGWDSLLYMVFLILSVPPALGCIIGFVADEFWRKRSYCVSCKTYAFLVAYPLIIIALCVGFSWYSNIGNRTVYDIPSKESVAASFDQNTVDSENNELIGYQRDQLHSVWGKPHGMLSGFWGDIWKVDDQINLVVYYDAAGIIEYVKVERSKSYEDSLAAVTVDDKIYYITEGPIPMEVDPSAYLGYALPYMESVPEAGYYDPDMEMTYAMVDGGIVVLYMDEWYRCKPAEGE